MLLRTCLVALIVAPIAASPAAAQPNITVQLPTFNATTVQTTVSVPDGGTGLLGGISRASEGSVTRGVPMLDKIPGVSRLFKNRGIGRDVGVSQMTVSPRIISLEEEELRQTGFSYDTAQLSPPSANTHPLAMAAAPALDPEVARQADFLARNIARHPDSGREVAAGPSLPSVAEVRRQNELAQARRTAEAAECFAKGQRAEVEGKPGVAKVWYEMAARRADGDLAGEVAERLAVLSGSPSGDKLAGR